MAGPMLHPPPRLALTVPRRGCWRSRSEGPRMCMVPDALQAAGRRAGGAALQLSALCNGCTAGHSLSAPLPQQLCSPRTPQALGEGAC